MIFISNIEMEIEREEFVMEYILQVFEGISFSSVIIFIAAIAFLVTVSVKIYKFIVNNHDNLQEKDNTLKQIAEDLKGLKDGYNELKAAVNDMAERQHEMNQRQEKIKQETCKYKLNELRDKLLQSYRYYTNKEKNPMLAWSEMEKETFDELFKDYEELGGDGFMHSTVQPAMASLDVISMQNTQLFAQLMQSRKG